VTGQAPAVLSGTSTVPDAWLEASSARQERVCGEVVIVNPYFWPVSQYSCSSTDSPGASGIHALCVSRDAQVVSVRG
jgi:hypothetical protein